MDRTILHIDVNSAFLSWSAAERIKNGVFPDLRSLPSVVGGNKNNRKGIVLAASIPAKKLGIKTGEELYKSFQKCKSLEVVPPNYRLYEKYSKQMFEICGRFSPFLESFSVDELFLDYTNMDMHFGPPTEGARKIQKAIWEETGVTVNVGISTNKLLAKMASDFEKPNKIHTLFPDEIKKKMWPLPVSSLLMIGRKTTEKLHNLGIKTIGQLAKADDNMLKFHFKSQGKIMKGYANGIDLSEIKSVPDEVKSISNGTTLPKDVLYPEQSNEVMLSLCEKVSSRMRAKGFSCNHLTLYLKDKNFNLKSQCVDLKRPVFTTNELYEYSKQLFLAMWNGTPIRAVTISVSKFSDMDFYQYNFFDNKVNKRLETLDKQIDSIRSVYGYGAITRASLLGSSVAYSIAHNNSPRLSAKL